jgi:hypothetical protein
VQAQRYEGRRFLAAGDLPCGAARNILSGSPDFIEIIIRNQNDHHEIHESGEDADSVDMSDQYLLQQ